MEFVSLIVDRVVKPLADYITEKLSNFTCSDDLVKEMTGKMDVLEAQSTDYENKMNRNREGKKDIPTRLPAWLVEVKNIKEKVKKIKEDCDKITSNSDGCFNLKKKCLAGRKKYLAGRNALKHIKVINRLTNESCSTMKWTNDHIGFGRVNYKRLASTSGGGTKNRFKSRHNTFNDALKLLQQNDNDDDAARVIALCGMGGVGKSTLMNDLKMVAKNEKMFDCIVKVVVGNTPNLLKMQKVIAADTGEPLNETDETLMATHLSERFENFSERKEKILVILDDVWKEIKLEDIGLASPLPKGVKLLLTSRNQNICHQIAVHAKTVLKDVRVDVLEEQEAQDLFSGITGVSEEHDPNLYDIGCRIVKKCGCLPYAIEIIAATLIGKDEHAWRNRLKRLKKNDLDENVKKIINISYENLVDDDKAIFLLCGLFPEDSNIPIEDLTRYAWGLELLKDSSMEDARDSTQTSVGNLKDAYLLMNGDSLHIDCVKMHDLVLAFVVDTVSKGVEDGCRIIHHDDFSKLSKANKMSQSCKQISLALKGMSEFPSEFKFPNLSLLKLMHGIESLRFPQDFYVGMEKLQVIAFEMLEYPLVPTSLQFSTNLRTLCLHECSLMFDLNCIGNLSNLEVLSFANSNITILPSTFGKLKELRVLDVTGCYNLVIDEGVLKSLVKLEELYMRSCFPKACCFTDNNFSELAARSKNLCALEFEFIGNNAHMKNMSYEKLKRFKLSVGCNFREVRWLGETRSYQNSLKLITNREELSKCKINELFKITRELYLEVNDMNSLEDIDLESPHPQHSPQNSSFNLLRVLAISRCAKLKYLFTPSVAKSFSKLEYLDIYECHMMKAVIHNENDGSDIFKFSNLKFLSLSGLPELLHFCNNVDVIELPSLTELKLHNLGSFESIYPSNASSSVSSNVSRVQSFFPTEDATPKLELLFVSEMELKEIWHPQFCSSNLCLLKELRVKDCDCIEVLFNMDFSGIKQLNSSLRSITVDGCFRLVKLFSCNPFPFLNNLQELKVKACASIEVIFNVDMGCVAETDEVSSSLKSIYLKNLRSLRVVWRIKDAGNNLIRDFEAVERIFIKNCMRFENMITPATTNIDMRALKEVEIIRCGRESEGKNELAESIRDQEISVVSIPGKESNDTSNAALPSYLVHTFCHLRTLVLRDSKNVEVVFEITNSISRESAHNSQQLILLACLKELNLYDLERMSHVWKCNWTEILHLPKLQSQSSFHNLTTITMESCNSIKYLFSTNMAKLLSNLKVVDIKSCDGIEEVVSNRDDEDTFISSHTTTTFFPRLDLLCFYSLKNFECIGGGADGVPTDIHDQHKLSQAAWSLCQYAREISIEDCDALSSVIPWYAVGKMQKLQVLEVKNCKSMTEVFESQEINNKSGIDTGKSLPKLEYITMLQLPKLKIMKIQGCHLLKHIFTFSTLESLTQLEELLITDCEAMEVIVKKDNEEQTTTFGDVVFPHLKSLILFNLPNFVGFFLGKNGFEWKTLEIVEISECPQITVFTYGWSTAPNLNFIYTSLGKHSVECGLNFRVTTTPHQARLPSYGSTSSHRPTIMECLPWSYHNLIEMDMNYNPSGERTLFSFDKLPKLKKLETVHFRNCEDTEEIFEVFDSQTVAEVPQLRQVELEWLSNLKYIWTSKQWTVLEFANLTRLSILGCPSLEYVFTCSMVRSISQLQELHISHCYGSMKVIVKGEEESDAIVTVVLPCLKVLKLKDLDTLEGFCLGKEAFEFPSLDTLHLDGCGKMTVFTKGDLSAPKLHAIGTWDGKYNMKYNIHNSLNSFLNVLNKRN